MGNGTQLHDLIDNETQPHDIEVGLSGIDRPGSHGVMVNAQRLAAEVADNVGAMLAIIYSIDRDNMRIDPVAYSIGPIPKALARPLGPAGVIPPRLTLMKNPLYYQLWQGKCVLDGRVEQLDPDWVPSPYHAIFSKTFSRCRYDLFPIFGTSELEGFLMVVRTVKHPIHAHVDGIQESVRRYERFTRSGTNS